MGDFGAIVRVWGRVVGDQGHDVPMGDAVAAQLVGHETRRLLTNISGRPADDWLGSSIAETVIRDHGAGPWSLTSAPTAAAPETGAARYRFQG